jgi:archaellum biogenesis ATPase FlaH
MAVLESLPEVVAPVGVAKEVLALKRYNVGMQLAASIGAREKDSKVQVLVEEYLGLLRQESLSVETEWEDAADWSELCKETGLDRRIPLAPMALNVRCGGGALPGHHILVYARPEMGKSLFALNMAAGFLKAQRRVLYIGNEDSIHVLKKRMLVRLSGIPATEIDRDKAKEAEAIHLATVRSAGNLHMRHLHRGSCADVEMAVKEFQPEVLILDQIRNLEAKTADGKTTERLEAVATGVRGILARHHLVGVSVTQANDRTERYGQEPPIWLGMSDVDSSRTGLPAQVDLMVGIGGTRDMISRGERAISLAKNKLDGGPISREGFTCRFDTLLGRIE